jgi:hypothetical protein
MQKKNFIHFSFFLFIIWLAVGGLVAGDNSENLFFRNNLIPSFTSSLFLKLPENIKFRSDNFYSSPNSLFFLTIRNLSKNITKDLLKYQDKEVEIKVYSLVDRLKSEIFPYSEKYDTRGILISSSEKPIGIFCLNSNIISSIDGKNFISVDISEENLERFFKKYKSISMTKRDVYLKNLSPENILKDMVLSFNNKLGLVLSTKILRSEKFPEKVRKF